MSYPYPLFKSRTEPQIIVREAKKDETLRLVEVIPSYNPFDEFDEPEIEAKQGKAFVSFSAHNQPLPTSAWSQLEKNMKNTEEQIEKTKLATQVLLSTTRSFPQSQQESLEVLRKKLEDAVDKRDNVKNELNMVHYNSLAQLGKLCDEVLKFEAESHQAQQESQRVEENMVLAREKLRKDCESLVKKETDIRLAIDDLKKKSLELRQQIQQTRTKTKALRRSRKYETDDLQAQIRQAEKDFEEANTHRHNICEVLEEELTNLQNRLIKLVPNAKSQFPDLFPLQKQIEIHSIQVEENSSDDDFTQEADYDPSLGNFPVKADSFDDSEDELDRNHGHYMDFNSLQTSQLHLKTPDRKNEEKVDITPVPYTMIDDKDGDSPITDLSLSDPLNETNQTGLLVPGVHDWRVRAETKYARVPHGLALPTLYSIDWSKKSDVPVVCVRCRWRTRRNSRDNSMDQIQLKFMPETLIFSAIKGFDLVQSNQARQGDKDRDETTKSDIVFQWLEEIEKKQDGSEDARSSIRRSVMRINIDPLLSEQIENIIDSRITLSVYFCSLSQSNQLHATDLVGESRINMLHILNAHHGTISVDCPLQYKPFHLQWISKIAGSTYPAEISPILLPNSVKLTVEHHHESGRSIQLSDSEVTSSEVAGSTKFDRCLIKQDSSKDVQEYKVQSFFSRLNSLLVSLCPNEEERRELINRLSGGINVRSIALVSNEELQKQMEVLCSQAPLLLTEIRQSR